MKKEILRMLLIPALMALTPCLNAQPVKAVPDRVEKDILIRKNPGCGIANCIPNLTDDQKAKIEKLHMAHKKEMMLNKAVVKEKKAHLNVLLLADPADMIAINKTIDDIAASKADGMKKKIAFKMEVKKLLTDEQKLVFDRCMSEKGGECGKGEMKMQKKIIRIEEGDIELNEDGPCKSGVHSGCKGQMNGNGCGKEKGEGCKGGR